MSVVPADGRRVDQVISLRWPSYAVRHPAHVSWLNHTAREYYDLWDRFSAGLSSANRMKERVRRSIIHRADTWLLSSNVTRLVAQSKTVQQRLRRFNGLESEVVYPPAPQRAYRCEAFEPFVFAVSRFAPLKRLDLLVEALARPEAAGIRAVIAGDGEQWSAIRQLVSDRGLADRVALPGRIDDEALVDYYAMPCRRLHAARRGLWVRHGGSVREWQARDYDHRQRRPRRARGRRGHRPDRHSRARGPGGRPA